MKKILLIPLLMFMMMMPVKAVEYTSANLEEVLTEESIEHDLSKYSEDNNQAVIYMFRGRGCAYCEKFLTFLNSIVPEYGKYFKLVSYEVWYNSNNSKLFNEVAKKFDTDADGVPFIVIGDKYFAGYSSSDDEQIKKAIMDLYNSNDRYDIMNHLNDDEKKNNTPSVDYGRIISWNLVFVLASTIVIIYYINLKNKEVISLISKKVKK